MKVLGLLCLLLLGACQISLTDYHCVMVTDSVVTMPPDTVATLDCTP